MALADPLRALPLAAGLVPFRPELDVRDRVVDRDLFVVREPPFGLFDVRVAMLHTVTTYVTFAPHATRMVSSSAAHSMVSNVAIMAMSSCSRLWQWKTYAPV